MAADTKVAKEFKDIFELGGVPAFNQFYEYGIFIWKYLYKGFYKPWHLIDAPTIADQFRKREMFRLDLAKATCAELAGLIWSEQCDVNVNRKGWEPTEAEPEDILDQFIHKVLQENGFWTKMQGAIEQNLALGGEALKVWFEDFKKDGQPVYKLNADGSNKVDSDGYAVVDGAIRIGYCMADQFIPTAWNNAEVTEGVFISRQAKNGYYWTKLEWHKWEGETYVVTNELYRAEIPKNGESQDILGMRYPLDAMFPGLNERTEIHGLERSLFSYFKTPMANNIDDNSPLGISIYANALATLHALDICYDSFVREFRLGKKRIIVPARCIRTVTDPETGHVRRYFDANDETYEALSTEDPDSLKIQDNSVELRVEEHVEAMNTHLSVLCLQLGFSAGTFTFDVHGGLKTATEVISEASKTYKTVKTHQAQIREAIKRLVDNIIAVACMYGVDFEGEDVSAMVEGGYEVKIQFDDSIIQDRQTNINEGVMLVSSGLMSKTRFLTDPKYGQGLTEEDAAAELERIAQERQSQVSALSIDKLDFNTTEV